VGSISGGPKGDLFSYRTFFDFEARRGTEQHGVAVCCGHSICGHALTPLLLGYS
jgi:hypothetical protein